MNVYSSLADDYYINLNLNTEMTLPQGRETILGFFERIQKQYPSMRNFYTRENGDFVLEEDKDQPHQRWISLEPRRICSGVIDPLDVDSAVEQHALMLRLAPYMLSVSPLECEALDYMMGFDFSYRGNHDELVAEARRRAGPRRHDQRAGHQSAQLRAVDHDQPRRIVPTPGAVDGRDADQRLPGPPW